MNKEMININANLIKEPTFGSFMKEDKKVHIFGQYSFDSLRYLK